MRNYRNLLNRKARRSGSALIEFALVAVIFFTMLLGMVQLGLYQSTTSTLWNLSREGARYATVGTPTDADITQHVKDFAPPNIKLSNLTVAVSPVTTRVSSQPVTVTLTYNMQDKIIFPAVGSLLKRNGNYLYTTNTTMRVE